jgi:hypothetical protein
MHSATTATGRPLPPPGKTAASAPAALPLAAFSGISNRNKIAFKNPRNPMKINAAPLSNRNTNPVSAPPPPSAVSALADSAVPFPAVCAGRQLASSPGTSPLTSHCSPAALYESRPLSRDANHIRSNRHSVRLENAISHRKQTTAHTSNRHFFALFARNANATKCEEH